MADTHKVHNAACLNLYLLFVTIELFDIQLLLPYTEIFFKTLFCVNYVQVSIFARRVSPLPLLFFVVAIFYPETSRGFAIATGSNTALVKLCNSFKQFVTTECVKILGVGRKGWAEEKET